MSHVPNEKSILRTARRRVNAFGAAFDERIRSALAVVYKWKSSKFRSADTPRLTDHRAWELHVLLSAFVLCAFELSGTVVAVKHKEATAHGFIVLRTQEGQTLAAGDMIQTVEGENVTSELTLHFGDGSVHDEVAVFSEKEDFRLISDHLRQQGPTFPKSVDAHIKVADGDVEVSSEQNGKRKNEQHHLQIPEDVSNGLMLTLLKNISPSGPETTVSMVTPSSKPRVVKLKIHSEGKQLFSASGERLEAIHYVIHTEIGGIAGAIAPIIGKQPADLHFWIVGGKAPTFVKFTGQLYEGGPVWNIELSNVHWENDSAKNEKH